MLVANDLNEPGAGFAHDTNRVVILTPQAADTSDGGASTPRVRVEPLPLMDKRDLAARIVSRLASIRQERLADNEPRLA